MATYTQNFANVETSDSVIPFLELCPGEVIRDLARFAHGGVTHSLLTPLNMKMAQMFH